MRRDRIVLQRQNQRDPFQVNCNHPRTARSHSLRSRRADLGVVGVESEEKNRGLYIHCQIFGDRGLEAEVHLRC